MFVYICVVLVIGLSTSAKWSRLIGLDNSAENSLPQSCIIEADVTFKVTITSHFVNVNGSNVKANFDELS